MDRMGRLGGSAEVSEDTFQDSMARLSVHLATRHPTHALPDPLPPPRRFAIAWPYVLLVAIVGAGAVAYPYYRWLVQDDAPRPSAHHVTAAISVPTPVLAAIAVGPEAAPPARTPAKTEPPVVDVAASIPAPPEPAPPVTLPEPQASPAPQAPEIALSRSEIIEIQKRLASLDINPGPIDGVVGPRTTAGAQKYEAKVGRDVTGKVDRGLLALLRQDPDASPNLEARAP
jgi:Putative peptidoglycan binding domain